MSPRRRFLRLPTRSRRALRADLDDELRFYFDMRAQELVEGGLSEPNAHAQAIEEFGDVEFTRRYCMEQDRQAATVEQRSRYVSELRQDITLALRVLRRSPGVAVTALITLALGIGATTAVFSVVDGLLLAPLPYTQPDRLLRVYSGHPNADNLRSQISPADYVDYRDGSKSFTGMAAFGSWRLTYTGGTSPASWRGGQITGNYFDVLGVRPALGRTIRDADAAPAAPPVIVLGDVIWRGIFAADPAIVGRIITVNGERSEVIGVMPATFTSPTLPADAWVPMDIARMLRDVDRARKFHRLGAVARLRPGVSVAQAKTELTSIAARLERDHPESNTGYVAFAEPIRDAIVGDTRRPLLVLMGAAMAVLLIACANVGGIQLSRAVARRRELATRVALGAGRGRLVRQLVVESLVIGAIGGALGLGLAVYLRSLLVRLGTGTLPATGEGSLDLRMLVFSLVASVGSGVIVGLLPAFRATRTDVRNELHDASSKTTAGASRQRLQSSLLTVQFALSIVLLIGAGLLTRSLVALTQTALGFTMDRILTFQVNVGPSDKYSSSALEDQFFDAVETSLRALPGVRGIATAGYPPLGGGASSSLAIEGRNIPEGQTPEVGYIPVSDDYFKLLQIPLRAGRAFDARDIKAAPPVVVLSEGLVKQQWPDGGALGARVRLGPNPRDPWATVVGIAGDIRQSPQVGPRPMAYVSRRQDHWGSGVVFIAAKGDPRAMLPVVQRAVQEIDPDMPLIGVRTMDEYFTQSLGTQRLPMIMLSAFALLAVVLAAVGIYGVTAYAVTARTRELGIRVALGAQRQAVLRLVIGGGMRLLLAGVVIGLAAAAALTRLLAALLVGVEPLDLPTFGAAAVTLSAVTLVACWLPARRATRVDPIVALRSE